jgi:hypothetical protein
MKIGLASLVKLLYRTEVKIKLLHLVRLLYLYKLLVESELDPC